MQEYVAGLTRVESDFLDRIKESAKLNATYQKLVQDVTAGLVRYYWLEDGLLYAKGGKLYVPSGKIRRELLKETRDPQWAGHPGKDRIYALLSRSYYWPKIELDIELYVKTCLVCQQDKGLTQKEASLLQPLPILESQWVSVSIDFITGLPKVKGMGSASQKNWLDLLDSTQFAYNLHKSSSTEMSPFELAMGQQPLTPHEIVK